MDNALTFFARTETGLVRPSNQDLYGVVFDQPVLPASFILADGMGGHANGQLAAELAVSTLTEYLSQQLPERNVPETIVELLEDAIQKANVRIYMESLEDESNFGMGTTLTMVVLYEESIYLAHVGDSRCYLLRDNELEQLTRDQNLAGELVMSGAITREESRHHPNRNVLTQALGSSTYLAPEVLHVDRRHGDRLLLCSDGLHGPVPDQEIRTVMRKSKTPEAATNQLVDLALAAGGPDNVTAIVIYNTGVKS
ncbi:MAG TPA: Stp1/IreP family PP2C-type Ser/Thr phosphatase [Fastidiosipila sp.]|jgi:serine/threonine protein phosphatase PrpC|nr:Stp1/IreP family PP2C-type Ser/Thr phosphatase [Fastidiosipila sp.]